MLAQTPIDPNELIDPTGVGWEEGVLAAVVAIVAVILGAFTRRMVRSAMSKWTRAKPDVAVFLGRLAGWFVVLLGVVAALMILGFQLGPMVLILGVVVVIIFLSARSLLENFGAGIVLQAENAFRIGDLVEIANEEGTVSDITGRTTVIDTYDGRRVRVPNIDVLSNPIVNSTELRSLRTAITVGVEYGTDLDRARDVLTDVLEGIDGVMGHPAPEVYVTGFGDSSIEFLVRFWHDPTLHSSYVVRDLVARSIARRLKSEGIVIAFPQMVVWRGRTEEEA